MLDPKFSEASGDSSKKRNSNRSRVPQEEPDLFDETSSPKNEEVKEISIESLKNLRNFEFQDMEKIHLELGFSDCSSKSRGAQSNNRLYEEIKLLTSNSLLLEKFQALFQDTCEKNQRAKSGANPDQLSIRFVQSLPKFSQENMEKCLELAQNLPIQILKGAKNFLKRINEEKNDLEEVQLKLLEFERNFKNDTLFKWLLDLKVKLETQMQASTEEPENIDSMALEAETPQN